MSMSRLDPERIVNNFRLQTFIEEEIEKARPQRERVQREIDILNSDPGNFDPLNIDTQLLTDLALLYIEIGDWKFATACIEMAEKSRPDNSNEVLAIKLYVEGTILREQNKCDEAIRNLAEALLETPSPWLRANIYRNAGLAYLKKEGVTNDPALKKDALTQAHHCFRDGYEYLEFVTTTPQGRALTCSMPAMRNYRALVMCKLSLLDNQYPEAGLAEFEATSQAYHEAFQQSGLAHLKSKSHDWHSHNFHRAMILVGICKSKLPLPDNVDANALLKRAISSLETVLQGRIDNKADGQRLGDVCYSLGEAHELEGNKLVARTHYTYARWHYLACFPTKPGVQEAPQVKKATDKLLSLHASVAVSATHFNATSGGLGQPSTPAAAPNLQMKY